MKPHKTHFESHIKAEKSESRGSERVPKHLRKNSRLGFIKLHRKLRKHWLWEDAEKLKAWLDILMEVNHGERKVLIGNKLVTCKRGESCHSILSWSNRWNWSRRKVRRFFEMLADDTMIGFKTHTKTTYLKVMNYSTYQDTQTSDAHQTDIKRTSNAHQTHTNKELEVIKKNEKEYVNNFIFLKSHWSLIIELYPNLNDLQSAIRQWNYMKANESTAMDIVEAIKGQKISGQLPDNQFCPLLKNWLKNERWKDAVNSPSDALTYEKLLDRVYVRGETTKDYKRGKDGLWSKR
ncbi:hypothetical protein CL614_08355 [archaeon]|nr:hypothetical protein [archaeon]|tara:strand:- start:329 stop:1204 length:876 start_codon:yes stop_codon:yes gene_type:complete